MAFMSLRTIAGTGRARKFATDLNIAVDSNAYISHYFALAPLPLRPAVQVALKLKQGTS